VPRYPPCVSGATFTDADAEYVSGNYFTLEELCSGRGDAPDDVRALIERRELPAPSYVLDDGTEMFPADYFVLVDQAGGAEGLRSEFERRHRAAGGNPVELEEDWQGYLDGTYGVCLRQVLPETMVRKTELVSSLTALLEDPRPEDEGWRAQLRREVWELDGLEREFSPDYDRGKRFPTPPSRDRLVAAARERFADVFADRHSSRRTASASSPSRVSL
jgi:uncharacterized protein DUF6058